MDLPRLGANGSPRPLYPIGTFAYAHRDIIEVKPHDIYP